MDNRGDKSCTARSSRASTLLHTLSMSQAEPDVSVIRQTLMNGCNNYIHNSLPTYLLDVSRLHVQIATDRIPAGGVGDITLVSRDQVSKQILIQVEEDLKAIPPSSREKWCQVGRSEPFSVSTKLFYSHDRPAYWDTNSNIATLFCRIGGVSTSPRLSRYSRQARSYLQKGLKSYSSSAG